MLAYCLVGIGLESTTSVLFLVEEDIVKVFSLPNSLILNQASSLPMAEIANVLFSLAGRIELSLERPREPKV